MKTSMKSAAALLLALVLLLTACAPAARASTMYLRKSEGTVRVSDDAGKELDPEKELRLYSGYGLRTREESYAWIDLDSVKLTKMDEESRAEVRQEGKDLEIEVKEGGLFFNVTEPLEEDETMTIRTSTMMVGIRGTCGWVESGDDASRLGLLEGKVRCETEDGVVMEILAGELAEVTEDGNLRVTELTARDIPAFVLAEIEEDDKLYQQILDDSGLDVLHQPLVVRRGAAATFCSNYTAGAVITEDGTLWMRGWGMWGTSTNVFRDAHGGQTSDTFIPVMENVSAVCLNGERAGGGDVPAVTTAVIDRDGVLWMWGDGNLGDGVWSWRRTSGEPVRVMENVAAVSMGYFFTAALQNDGVLWCWGSGYLGNGSELEYYDEAPRPQRIMEDVAAVSTSGNTTAVIKTDGTLWMWGANQYGQIGNGSQENVLTPVKVMDDVAAVSVSIYHTAAIKTDGTLWMWGSNECGQLGSNRQGNSEITINYWDYGDSYDQYYTVSVPVQTAPVQVMESVASVCAHLTGSVAIQEDGSLWAWGVDEDGNDSALVTRVADLTYGSQTAIQTIPKKIGENAAAVSIGGLVLGTDGVLRGSEGVLMENVALPAAPDAE